MSRFRWMRVLSCTVAPIAAGTHYRLTLELSPGELAAWTCPLDPDLAATESKHYPPLGGTTTDADGILWYSSANSAFFSPDHQPEDGPHPAVTCHGLGFPDYGVTGGDAGGTGVSSIIRFVFLGPGTATFTMTKYASNESTFSWTQNYYKTGVGATTEQSGSGTTPETVVVTVDDLPADAESCYRYIDIVIGNPVTGGGTKVIFGGITWEAG